MRRALYAVAVFAFAARTSAAHADTSCDSNVPQTCCEMWIVKEQLDGKETGALTEHDYSKLQRALASAKRTDKALCAFWKDASSCNTTYGEPQCADDFGVKGTVDAVLDEATRREIKPILDKAIEELLSLAQQESKRIDSLVTYVRQAKGKYPKGAKSTFPEIGAGLREYAKLMRDGISRVQTLKRKLDAASKSAGFGFDSGGYDRDDILELLSAIASLSSATQYAHRVPQFDVPRPLSIGVDVPAMDPTKFTCEHKRTEFVVNGVPVTMDTNCDSAEFPFGVVDGVNASMVIRRADDADRYNPVLVFSGTAVTNRAKLAYKARVTCQGKEQETATAAPIYIWSKDSSKALAFLPGCDGAVPSHVSVSEARFEAQSAGGR